MSVSTEASVFLEAGDHLTRTEFHRRYCGRPDIARAELVEGVVYVPSPVRADLHAEPHGAIVGWLYAYTAMHATVRLLVDATVFLDAENEIQPDACLWYDAPGGPRMTPQHYLEGAPQFVVEIAASSASYDLHEKKEAYRRNGVREYVVWRVLDRAVDWFELREGVYVRREPDPDGIIESVQFGGLRLRVESLLAGDAAGVLSALGPATTS
jgi:Uma2 family endonuclease